MSFAKKIVAIATVLTMIGGPALGATIEELQAQIDALLSQLSTLQSQLAALQGTTPTVSGCTISSFDRNLSQGMSGDDVKCLQIILNSSADTQLAASGVGSSGNETNYFGPLTKAAVIKFQEKYASEILVSWGLTSGTGFVGSTTRTKLNTLIGAVGPTPPAAGLSVSLAADNPPAAVLASGTAYNSVLKLNLTASTEGTAKVTGIKVTKSGFSANTAITGVLVVDEYGVRHGNVVSSLAADNTATIDFSSAPIFVPAGQTSSVTIQIHLLAGSLTGTVQFSVAAPADVSTDAAQVSGTFPIWGNVMSLTTGTATVGGVTVDASSLHDNGTDDATVVNVNMNTQDQEIAKFRFIAGSAEDIEIKKLILWNNGSAADSDYGNIDLVDSAGNVLATAATAVNDVVTLDLGASPYKIEKGLTKDLTVRIDVFGGPNRTIRLVVQNDYDAVVGGVTTGASLLATANSGGTDTSFPIGDKGATNYMNKLTIAVGTLSLVRATDSPSTAVAAGATNVVLGKFAVVAYGEQTELRKVKFDIATGSASVLAGTVYVKWNDSTVYSIDASTVSLYDTILDEYTLTSYPVLQPGVEGYLTVVGTIKTTADIYDTYKASVDISQVRRLATGDILDPGVSSASGHVRSVKVSDLKVTTAATPLAATVVVGTQGHTFANIILDASGSGEDVRVTKITIADTLAASSTYADIGKLRLYDGANVLSTTNNTDVNAATVDFNLTTPLEVTRAVVKTITLKADVILDTGEATTTDTHTFKASTVTASGKDTGTALTVAAGNLTISGTGQAMAISGQGSLNVTVDSSWITKNRNVVVYTKDVDFTIFKMQAFIEDVNIKTIKVTATGTSLSNTDYENIRLVVGTQTVASVPQFATDNTNNFNTEGVLSISQLMPIQLKVVADITSPAASTLKDDLRFNIAAATDVVGSGAASGNTINAAAAATTAITSTIVPMDITTAVDSLSPSGEFSVLAGTTLAVFDVYNSGAATVNVTDFMITDTGVHTGATATAELSNYQTSEQYATNTAWTTTINFSSLSIPLNAGETKKLAVKVYDATGLAAGDTFRMTIATISDVKYSVTEANLGYDGNHDGDLADTISAVPGSSTAFAYTVTKK